MNMSTTVLTERITETSPRLKARMAGVFYALTAGTSVFGQFFVPSKLVVQDDAAATATNILAHQPFFRLGFAVLLLSVAFSIAMTALFYDLFKPVNKSLSSTGGRSESRQTSTAHSSNSLVLPATCCLPSFLNSTCVQKTTPAVARNSPWRAVSWCSRFSWASEYLVPPRSCGGHSWGGSEMIRPIAEESPRLQARIARAAKGAVG
jgi:hypothetical protein